MRAVLAALSTLYCGSALALTAAPSLRPRASQPVALLDGGLPLLADAATAHLNGIEYLFSKIADDTAVLREMLDDVMRSADVMSAKLSSSLDAGRALQNDNGGAPLSGLDRSVIDVFEDVTAGGVDGLSQTAINAAESVESAVLDSIGHDLSIFLACASVATPLAQAAGVTPILIYLLFGALLGPHGFDVFSSASAGVELGDFGILFLLFAEGLEVTTERLAQLITFLPLGLAQISMTAGVLTFAILGGLSQAVPSPEAPLSNTLRACRWLATPTSTPPTICTSAGLPRPPALPRSQPSLRSQPAPQPNP